MSETKLKIKIEIKSSLLLGSAEGLGAIIDTDIVFDDYGLPVFPGRRLKGLLRESAVEIKEMAGMAKLPDLAELFGEESKNDSSMIVDDLHPESYDDLKKWLEWAFSNHGSVVSRAKIKESLTELRNQTAVTDQGIVQENSLRTSRALQEGIVFEGYITLKSGDDADKKLLAFACSNLRRAGTMRNRGFGEIKCGLLNDEKDLTEKYLNEFGGQNEKN